MKTLHPLLTVVLVPKVTLERVGAAEGVPIKW
jgi:hypothetical protein